MRSPGNILHEYERRYGPYAFGFLSLLLVWSYIVAPTLSQNKLDASKLVDITMLQQRIADAQQATANVINSASQRMDSVAHRLERITDKIEAQKP